MGNLIGCYTGSTSSSDVIPEIFTPSSSGKINFFFTFPEYVQKIAFLCCGCSLFLTNLFIFSFPLRTLWFSFSGSVKFPEIHQHGLNSENLSLVVSFVHFSAFRKAICLD